MKKPLCITVFVFGNYTKYIPYYVYSILKSYPDYYVKIFMVDHLPDKVNACLDLIRNNVSRNFEVKENYFNDLKQSVYSTKKSQLGKVLRFLIPLEEFEDFENVYVGDVDFLIIKENPSILEGHLEHCKKIGLPYSNQIRPHSKRLTGLHFFKVEHYSKAMNPIINYYLNHLDKLYEEVQSLQSNENFLYNMIEKGLGFGNITNFHYRPHHGFHLGLLRGGKFKPSYYFKEGHKNLFHSLPTFPILKRKLLEFYHDPFFAEMQKVQPIKEILVLGKLLSK